jgi:hypothetical protein
MQEILYALQLIQALLGAAVGFASGTTTTAPPVTIGSKKWSFSAIDLPQGPTPQYPAISGGILSELGAAFGDLTAVELGQPVSIAVKVKTTWVGLTASPAAA